MKRYERFSISLDREILRSYSVWHEIQISTEKILLNLQGSAYGEHFFISSDSVPSSERRTECNLIICLFVL